MININFQTLALYEFCLLYVWCVLVCELLCPVKYETNVVSSALAPLDSTVSESINTGHRCNSSSNKSSTNDTSMSDSSNKSTMSNSSKKSSVSNGGNTDSPHPVGSNSMCGAGVIRDSSDRGPKGLGLGDPPVLALQRLVHGLVGDLTTSHSGNSHRAGNNTSANHRSSTHNSSMSDSSNKSTMSDSSTKSTMADSSNKSTMSNSPDKTTPD